MTAQVGDILIFNSEKTHMIFCPPLPKGNPSIVELKYEDIEESNEIIISSACWRGYIATWELKNELFFLVDIAGKYKMTDKNPIFANWFSGVIRIPKGEIIHYVHMGFESIYEEEIHVKIENGKVVKSNIIDNRNKEFDTFL